MSLKRQLGLWGVFSISAGAMISSGLFVLPGLAFREAGPATVVAYLLAGLLNLPAMFAQAELSTAMPKSGGSYFTIERSLGTFAGTLAGFISWLCISLKAAFACVGLGTLVLLVRPDLGEWGMKTTALLACLFFTVMNLTTVKGTGRLQGMLVAGLLGAMLLYAAAGAGRVEAVRFSPFFSSDWGAFFSVTGMVFISFGGLTKVVDVAEEVSAPQRNLPLGMFLSFAVVNLLYLAVVFVTVGVLPAEELAGSLAPLSLGARVTMGTFGVAVLSAAAFLAYATTANAGILAASRSPMAMSRDGLLPAGLARTGRRFGTPHTAVLLTALFMAVVIVFLSVEDLAKTASTMFLVSFLLACLSVLVMRRARIPGYRPSFRMPLCPWLPIAGVLIYAFLITDMGWVPLLSSGAFFVATGLWYLAYVRWRITRESAAVYLARSMMSSQVARAGIEDELVQISLEREGIAPDRFDELVRRAPVLDIAEELDARGLFARLAAALAPRLGMTPERVEALFLERERESSTVIHTGLAVPHIVVDGRGAFEVVLARCRPGAKFDELHRPVQAVFALAGSQDERNFHLKALMAVAHIIQERGFEERWLGARNAEQLRDLVLLARRKRSSIRCAPPVFAEGPPPAGGDGVPPPAGDSRPPAP